MYKSVDHLDIQAFSVKSSQVNKVYSYAHPVPLFLLIFISACTKACSNSTLPSAVFKTWLLEAKVPEGLTQLVLVLQFHIKGSFIATIKYTDTCTTLVS